MMKEYWSLSWKYVYLEWAEFRNLFFVSDFLCIILYPLVFTWRFINIETQRNLLLSYHFVRSYFFLINKKLVRLLQRSFRKYSYKGLF